MNEKKNIFLNKNHLLRRKSFPKEYSTGQLLLIAVNILFLILYTLLSYFNRLPYEDYTFTWMAKHMGAIHAMKEVYIVYSARWSSLTLGFYFSRFYESTYFLMLFNLITLAVLAASFYLLLKRLLNTIVYAAIENKILLSYSLLFTCCLFFSSYSIGQVWFWYMVNWMYLWSIIAGNFLFWILLQGKLKITQLPFILILTAYIAGADESYPIIYLLFIALLLFLKKKTVSQSASIILDRISIRWLVITLIFLSLFYMVTILAPGTWARKNMLTDATFAEHMIRTIRSYGKIILIKTPKLIPYLILFGLPWMLLGQEISSVSKIEVKKLLPRFLKSIFVIGALIFVLILPASWVLYELAPDRALSQVSLLLAIYASFAFFYTGYKVKIEKKFSQLIVSLGLVLSILILSFQIFNQYSIVNKFSDEYDKRIKYLLEENSSGRKNTVFLEPMPSSGMIYSDELSADTLGHAYLENVYGLKFHVAVKK